MLEVVSVSREDELRSLRAARDDRRRLGARRHPRARGRRDPRRRPQYCPFPGTIDGHPSVLKGSIDGDRRRTPRELTALDGVHGVDLLAYRHATRGPDRAHPRRRRGRRRPGDRRRLGRARFEQIAALEAAGAWGFTIGSAIFAGQLPGGPSVAGQVAAVLAAMTHGAAAVAGRPGPPGPARRPRRRQARAGRQAAQRERDRRALRRQPRDRARGRARPDGGRLPHPPPRLRAPT